jgi:hypothetical protein
VSHAREAEDERKLRDVVLERLERGERLLVRRSPDLLPPKVDVLKPAEGAEVLIDEAAGHPEDLPLDAACELGQLVPPPLASTPDQDSVEQRDEEGGRSGEAALEGDLGSVIEAAGWGDLGTAERRARQVQPVAAHLEVAVVGDPRGFGRRPDLGCGARLDRHVCAQRDRARQHGPTRQVRRVSDQVGSRRCRDPESSRGSHACGTLSVAHGPVLVA